MEITWFWSLVGLLSVPLFVVLNGLFVAAEFARWRSARLASRKWCSRACRGPSRSKRPWPILTRTIAATQLGITLASIALGWLGEPALARVLRPLFTFLPSDWQGG